VVSVAAAAALCRAMALASSSASAHKEEANPQPPSPCDASSSASDSSLDAASSSSDFSSSCRALVPFTHANIHYNPFSIPERSFAIGPFHLNMTQITSPQAKAGTGSAVWDAGFVLSEYIFRRIRFRKAGLRAVDLGTGLGLNAIVLALLGMDVVATDGDDRLFPTLRANLERNLARNEPALTATGHRAGRVTVQQYWWGDDVTKVGLQPPYDLVCGSDLIYQVPAMEPLLKAFNDLSREDTEILYAYKIRYEWQREFLRKAEVDFEVEQVPRSRLHPDFQNVDGIELARLRKRRKAVDGAV